jgi:multidrug efflux pump subunit AcrA (membrane-fusion protein)
VKLYPQVDRQKGTLKVEVRILEPDRMLLPDMSARITFLGELEAARAGGAIVLVPAAAVRRDDHGDSVVFVVDDGRARRVRVETGGGTGERVQVVSGLAGGETVVTSDDPLADGQRVQSR